MYELFITRNQEHPKPFDRGNKHTLVRIMGGIIQGLVMCGYRRQIPSTTQCVTLQKGEEIVTLQVMTYAEFKEI